MSFFRGMRLGVAVLILCLGVASKMSVAKTRHSLEKATFAGGCFWCMQPAFDDLDGVISTAVGYTDGHISHPTYAQVCTGLTGHTEGIEIEFDPSKISYAKIVDIFWKNIDPTAKNQQFSDVGTQYRTAIFYHDERQKKIAEASKKALEKSGKYHSPIVVEIKPVSEFYQAETYHQKYYKKNSTHYQRYKIGSGRAAYIDKMGGEP